MRCLPLLLLILTSPSLGRILIHSDEPIDRLDRCVAEKRESVFDAISDLFTCLFKKHVEQTEAYKTALTINYQDNHRPDQTYEPLLSNLYSKNQLMKFESYSRYFDLVPIYNKFLGVNENHGEAEQAKIRDYLAFLMRTPFMQDLYETLKVNNAYTGTAEQFSNTIFNLWFKLYGRKSSDHSKGIRESSGFEHVLIGEIKSNSDITGFHSWLQILEGERDGSFAYQGYYKHRNDIALAMIRIAWHGRSKTSSFFFGVPPEFELALFSACALVNPNRSTRLTVDAKPVSVMIYTVNHQSHSVGTAYGIA